jgi:hypothetical protein
MADRLRLPGFVAPIEPWLAACDALLNVSRHEGLSIGVQEALAAGLPVVATDVGGQGEIEHPGLELLARDAGREFAARLERIPVRARWTPAVRARAASLVAHPHGAPIREGDDRDPLRHRKPERRRRPALAGEPVTELGERHRSAIVVCGETTHPAFTLMLAAAGAECFRASELRDDLAIARVAARARLGPSGPQPVLLERGARGEARGPALRARGAFA